MKVSNANMKFPAVINYPQTTNMNDFTEWLSVSNYLLKLFSNVPLNLIGNGMFFN